MSAEKRTKRSSINQSSLYGLLFLSGIAGLGYELVWIRMFALGMGHEIPSMLAVVGAFFGGLALGAWAFDSWVSRSEFPGRWYAVLEMVIGSWAAATVMLIPWANLQVARLTGLDPGPVRHWLVGFMVPFVTLLPATAAMGATLPAMDRLFCRWRESGRSVGGLYAANTFGAVVGVLMTTFACVPLLGHRQTVLILAILNVTIAVIVAALYHRKFPVVETDVEAEDRPSQLRLGITLLVTGLLGIGYEVLGVRVMAQVLENTVYSFATALSVYLLGTAVGAAAYQAFGGGQQFNRLLKRLLVGQFMACLLGMLALMMSRPLYNSMTSLLGPGIAGAVMAEMVLAVFVFGLPTCLMGAIFSHLAQAARRSTGGVGKALAANTLGGALGPPLFAVCLLPLLGAKWVMGILALLYLALIPRPTVEIAYLAITLVLLFIFPFDLVLVRPIGGGEIITYREGVMATVSVVSDDRGDQHLKVNDRFRMGGTSSQFGERREGHIPLLLHSHPESALFLGLGTGISFASAADHPNLTAKAVELVPEVVDVLPYFKRVTGDLSTFDRLTVSVADARRYVAVSTEQYDVIVADLFHPARDGAGSLYTLEHFAAVRQRLAPEGIFCQWLPLYQMDLETLRVIVRTFLTVFPEARAYLLHFNVEMPVVGLVGSDGAIHYPSNWLEHRVTTYELTDALYKTGLPDDLSLFGTLLALPEQLNAFAEGRRINTDDRPVVTFVAPRFAYAEKRPAYLALDELLELLELETDPRVGDEAFRRRLADYCAARNLYLRGEMQRVLGNEAGAIDSYVASIQKCQQFRIGYTMAVAIAQKHARTKNYKLALEILLRVIDADPSRPEAFELRSQIQRYIPSG